MRAPLVISWPDIESDVESDALVEFTDLAPTVLEAAGLEEPLGVQGQSLYPLLTGETDPDNHRTDVYAEHYADQEPVAEGSEALHTMIRTDRYKLVRSHGTDEGELYDLDEDPAETHNRWDDPNYADAKRRLLVRLSDRMAETVDPLPEQQGDW